MRHWEGAKLASAEMIDRVDEWIMALARYGRQSLEWAQDLPLLEVWRQFKILKRLVERESQK